MVERQSLAHPGDRHREGGLSGRAVVVGAENVLGLHHDVRGDGDRLEDLSVVSDAATAPGIELGFDSAFCEVLIKGSIDTPRHRNFLSGRSMSDAKAKGRTEMSYAQNTPRRDNVNEQG